MWLFQGSVFLFTVETEDKGRSKKWFCQVQCGGPMSFLGLLIGAWVRGYAYTRTQERQVRTSQQILSQHGQQLTKLHRWSALCKLQGATPPKALLVPASSQPWFIAYVTWLGGVKFRDYHPLIHLKHSHCREFSSTTKGIKSEFLKLDKDQVPYWKLFPWKHTNGTNSYSGGSLFISACSSCCYKRVLQ